MASNKSGELVIMAVGDVLVRRSDPPSIFARIAPVLRQGDVVLGNLEGLYCDRGNPALGRAEVGSGHLRASPDNLPALNSGGFNVMGLANNHCMDFGPEGLLQTIELLDQMNIAHTGGGRNLEEAHRPAMMERNGVRVAILSYTTVYTVGYPAEEDKPGLATIKVSTSYQAPDNVMYQPGVPALVTTTPDPAEEDRMMADVRRAKEEADVVLVAFHWGVSQGYERLVGYQKELGRAAIDAGADVVLGAHPHSLQAIEIYKGKYICYCLGNFVMDGVTGAHFGADTMIVKCHVRNKKLEKLSFIPVAISDEWQPYAHDRENGMRVMAKMQSLATEFGTMFSMEDGEVVVSGPKPGTPEGKRGFAIEPRRGLPVLTDAAIPLPYIVKKLKKAGLIP